mgnify:CR=1 FL=1
MKIKTLLLFSALTCVVSSHSQDNNKTTMNPFFETYTTPFQVPPFDLIKNELIRSKTMDVISSGIVITGGSSMLNGAVELAESIFDAPVRLGLPRDIDGLLEVIENPRYATGVGLLKMGKEDKDKDTNLHLDGNTITNILKKMKLWFQGNF